MLFSYSKIWITNTTVDAKIGIFNEIKVLTVDTFKGVFQRSS